MPKFKVGDRVRLLAEAEPYYSGCAGSPKVMIPAGQEGIVGAVDVPFVRPVKGHRSFICVDLYLPGVFHFNVPKEENQSWRVAVYPDQIRPVK